MKKQSGFAALEILLVVVVVGLLAFTAFNFVSHRAAQDNASTASDVSVPAAPAVGKTSDLDKASRTLDAVNVDDSTADSSQLSSELNKF